MLVFGGAPSGREPEHLDEHMEPGLGVFEGLVIEGKVTVLALAYIVSLMRRSQTEWEFHIYRAI